MNIYRLVLLIILFAVHQLAFCNKDFVIPDTLIKQVEAGNAEIAYFISRKLIDGADGFNVDKEKGIKWLEKAANMDYAQAMLDLANEFEFDNNKEQALIWYLKAAKKGMGDAINMIGTYYYHGDAGVEKDCKTAYQWYEKAQLKQESMAFNNHAWNLATDANKQCRNPEKALKVIFALMKIYKNQIIPWYIWDTKAAVHAAVSDFSSAISIQSWIIEEMKKDDLDTSNYQKHLDAYLNRKPWIEN